MKYEKVIIQAIKKEALLITTLKKWGLVAEEGSALDLSYFDEISALWGIPNEKILKDNKINSDDFLDDYVACLNGETTVEKFFISWENRIKNIRQEYDSSQHKDLKNNFLKKEKALCGVLKEMSESSLSFLINDWDMADALFDKKTEEFHQDLFQYIEKNGSIDKLII